MTILLLQIMTAVAKEYLRKECDCKSFRELHSLIEDLQTGIDVRHSDSGGRIISRIDGFPASV